jgi:hypothetical protein
MNYSTLKEAYDVDTFEKKKKKKHIPISDTLATSDEHVKQPAYSDATIDVVAMTDTEPSMHSEKKQENIAKSEIQPYYDEELEQYLNYKDLELVKETPVNKIPETDVIPYKPLVSEKMHPSFAQPIYTDKKDMFYKNLVNIGLFIFIGTLIIFLCDQITEIAISLGMKRTVKLLEPYLRSIP